MSAMPKPADSVVQKQMTDDDWNALLQSELWMWKQDLLAYQKKWIAILGEKIIDSDSDADELDRRIEALGDTINRFQVLVRYIAGFDELYE